LSALALCLAEVWMPPEHLKPIVVSNGDHEVNAHRHLAALLAIPFSAGLT
jgi:hypothetical protein